MKKSITEYSDREENFIYGTNVPILPMPMGHLGYLWDEHCKLIQVIFCAICFQWFNVDTMEIYRQLVS